MKWNLRLAAASRGIWKASELQKMLAGRGLVISAGKMSGLWSGSPNAVKLADLDVICAVLGCEIGELLVPEPVPDARPSGSGQQPAATAAGESSARRRLSNSASEAISVRDNLLFTTIFSGDFVLDDFLWDHTFFRVPHSGRGTSTKCAWKAASARTDASQSKNLLHDVP